MKRKCLFTGLIAALSAFNSFAAGIPLQNATATFSQNSWSVATAIDQDSVDSGWAVQQLDGYGSAEVAVFQTVANVGFAGGTKLTFRLKTHYVNGDGPHNLGRFRISVTGDDRGTFADGLSSGGEVGANWTILDPNSYFATDGALLNKLSDSSVLASGPNAENEVYTIEALTTLPAITGVRLETLYDESLPHAGPGRSADGNFVLVDFAVSGDPVVRTDLITSVQVASVNICWAGFDDKFYQVQYASGLGVNEWLNLGLPVQGNGTNCVTDLVRGSEHRFYRVTDAP